MPTKKVKEREREREREREKITYVMQDLFYTLQLLLLVSIHDSPAEQDGNGQVSVTLCQIW